MPWHIWMKVGSKLLFEELQIKFYFYHDWPTFSWVIALCSKFVFRTFLGYAFTYLKESWYQASIVRVTDQFRLSSQLTHFFMSYPLFKIRFPNFSRLCFHISQWCLIESFHMKSYRSRSTFVTVDPLFHAFFMPFVQNLFSGLFLPIQKCTKLIVADLNLLGSVGDLYCFSNTLSMLVLYISYDIILYTNYYIILIYSIYCIILYTNYYIMVFH